MAGRRARPEVEIGNAIAEIALERNGRVHMAKALTAPAQPAGSVLAGMAGVPVEAGQVAALLEHRSACS
jgi:hypothetical protein